MAQPTSTTEGHVGQVFDPMGRVYGGIAVHRLNLAAIASATLTLELSNDQQNWFKLNEHADQTETSIFSITWDADINDSSPPSLDEGSFIPFIDVNANRLAIPAPFWRIKFSVVSSPANETRDVSFVYQLVAFG